MSKLTLDKVTPQQMTAVATILHSRASLVTLPVDADIMQGHLSTVLQPSYGNLWGAPMVHVPTNGWDESRYLTRSLTPPTGKFHGYLYR